MPDVILGDSFAQKDDGDGLARDGLRGINSPSRAGFVPIELLEIAGYAVGYAFRLSCVIGFPFWIAARVAS